MPRYNPATIESFWQESWAKAKVYQPDIINASRPYYNLWMFPYPSGARMHVGHAYASTGADIHGRFMRMQGYDVFQPMGFDAFGIHGENYALKVGRHPKELMDELCVIYRDQQFKRMGHGYDWSHEVRTYDPQYYKWTQWIFLQLYKHGLAERKKAPVNWCPSCKTVLADEQVIQGFCERCDTQVEQRILKQWFFKITRYAERLLENLEKINWPQRIKVMQKNWIGRSEGAIIKFSIVNNKGFIPVFTTRPDTLFGVTFFVLAPESKWVRHLVKKEKEKEVENYLRRARSLTSQQRVQQKEKTGVFTGSYVVNPINQERIPVYVADYVLAEYGSGALMGVPAHDQRDFEFAQQQQLEVRVVVEPQDQSHDFSNLAYEGEGRLVNSASFNGLSSAEAKEKIVDFLAQRGLAEKTIQYRLRDWLISRQRYWGPPIPIIYCPKCGEVPVPEKDLPVLLPEVDDWRPTGTEKSPLAAIADFVQTKCPRCGGKARRETDVSDNFLDSAWYYYAYPVFTNKKLKTNQHGVDKKNPDYPFQPSIIKKWFPVDMYVGGAEHAVLHLMYTRFLTMALKDIGLLNFDEPFKTFFAHGLITKDGSKMSKSKGNIVNPDEYINRVGADAFRTYLMFLGPYDQGGDFSDSGLQGIVRFLNKVWSLVSRARKRKDLSPQRRYWMNYTIKRVSEDIQKFSFNTAVAALMEWIKNLPEPSLSSQEAEVLLKLLAPFAPHMTEELWQSLQGKERGAFCAENSIHRQSWPQYEEKHLKLKETTLVVQINGKVKGRLKIPWGADAAVVEIEARKDSLIKKYLEGKELKRVVFVPNKIINFVLSD